MAESPFDGLHRSKLGVARRGTFSVRGLGLDMTSGFFAKNISEVTIDDIRSLVDAQVVERRFLEYKEDLPSNEKLSEIISSLANTDGGWTVFGIERNPETGEPLRLKHLPIARKPLDRIDQIAMTMAPPVRLESVYVDDPSREGREEQYFIVTRVEASELRPRMALSFRYYIRGDKGVVPASHAIVTGLLRAQQEAETHRPAALRRVLDRLPIGSIKSRTPVLLALDAVPTWPRFDIFKITKESKLEAENLMARELGLPRTAVDLRVDRNGLVIPSDQRSLRIGLGRFGQFRCALDFATFASGRRANDGSFIIVEKDVMTWIWNILRCAGAFYEICPYYSDLALELRIQTSVDTLLVEEQDEIDWYEMDIGRLHKAPPALVDWRDEVSATVLIGKRPTSLVNAIMQELFLHHGRTDFEECRL